MNVHWTNSALEQLLSIHDYIAKDSPVYASRMIDRITSRTRQVADLPRSGGKVSEYDSDEIRELIEGAYRIIYRIKREQIDILAVIHGARHLPPPS